MTDALDDLITEIQMDVPLSAEARNALHGATSGHPWCVGKGLRQRLDEVNAVTAGRMLNGHIRGRLEYLNRRTPRQTDPNMQGVPLRNDEAQRLRDAFVTESGNRMVEADYSQIELRVLGIAPELKR